MKLYFVFMLAVESTELCAYLKTSTKVLAKSHTKLPAAVNRTATLQCCLVVSS